MVTTRRQRVIPTTEKDYGQNEARGSTTRFARENHTHGTAGNPVLDHVSGDDPHSQYLKKDQTAQQVVTNGPPLFAEGIQFFTSPSITPTEVGSATWNNEDDCLDIHATNQVLQVGQELVPKFKNQTGATITNGTPVMFAGAIGASSRITIQKAIADGTIPAEYILGVATEDIDNGEDGHVTWFGAVRGLDTTGTPVGEVWADGDILYVSDTTAGTFTNVAPNAPNFNVNVAAVLNAHATQGSIFVRPSWLPKVVDLNDVNGTPLTTDGQILVWDNTNEYFDPDVNINDYLLVAKLLGTANQITVTESPTGTLTLSFENPTRLASAANIALGHYSEFEADGTLEFNGDATVWRDNNIGGVALAQGSSNQPSRVNFDTTNIIVYEFSASQTNALHGNMEHQHDAREGVAITPHIHWYPTNTNTGDVRWGLEYTIEAMSGTLYSGTIYVDATASGTAWQEQRDNFAEIGGANLVIGAQIHFRLFRDGTDAADTYNDGAAIATFGIHYEIDTVGSRQITSK